MRVVWCCFVGSLLMLGSGSVGCSRGDGTAKASHHEVEHYLPEHWPRGLDDLAVKMDRRVQRLTRGEAEPGDASELADLVGWAAEVAADTDLSEVQWLPIYLASESLAANLRAARGQWTEPNLMAASQLSLQIALAAESFKPATGIAMSEDDFDD